MAKCILFLLGLAVITASKSKIGGAAAADTALNLQQRQDAMAEELRLYSSPAWQENMVKLLQHVYDPVTTAPVADSETAHRVVSLVKRDMGPLGRILKVIGEMPENSVKDEAFDATMELFEGKLQLLLPKFSPFGFTWMPVTTAAEVRRKQEVRNVAKLWINDYLGQLRAASSVKIHDDL